jgi:RHS repeat-associated protein
MNDRKTTMERLGINVPNRGFGLSCRRRTTASVGSLLAGRRLAATVSVALCLVGSGGSVRGATTATTTTSFDYDTSSGLLTKTVVEPSDPNLCLVTAYTRDTYGRVRVTTTRNCNGSVAVAPGAANEAPAPSGLAVFLPRATTDDYSADQRFVAVTTNALSHVENKTYDGRFGTLASLQGPNQLTTNWTYDGLGRKTLETRADGTKTKWAYVFCTYPGYPTSEWPAGAIGIPAGAISAPCNTVPAFFKVGNNTVGPSSIRPVYYIEITPLRADGVTPNGAYTRTYYDTLGREVRAETQGFDGAGSGQIVYEDTTYDLAGAINTNTLPYSPGTPPVYSIGYTYDVLGRVTKQLELSSAGGPAATLTSYSGLSTTITDPRGFSTTQVKNVVGQVVRITDAKGGLLQKAYDALGNLSQTIDAKGNVSSMVYDVRRRKTTTYDPDMGVWTYVYSAAGEVVQQTDAKLQVISQSYDKLGRITSRTSPDLVSAWYYDSKYADGVTICNKGIGKLCEATASNGYSSKRFYDILGRLSGETSFINSQSYTTGVGYDPITGRVSSQTYPTGLQVNRVYSTLGFLRQLVDARNSTALWTATSQDAQGHLLQAQYGNGVNTVNTYFDDGRLNTKRAGANNSVQNLVYGYDLNRNVSARIDVATGVTAAYAYDELNRLTTESRSGGALGGSGQSITWAYDSIGNMASRTESGLTNIYNYNTSGTGSRRPHAVGSVSGSVNGANLPVYNYDNNGNLTSGAGRTVAWTSDNMVQSITAGAKQLTYHYSPAHERIKETYLVNGALQRTTVYLNPSAGSGLFFEDESGVAGSKKKHYVSAGGSTVAVIVCTATPCTSTTNTATQYWHEDHLGSVSAATDLSGAVVERMGYEPFGKRRNSNGVTDLNGTLTASSTDRGFTEQEHIDEVGLINFNGRIYDPGLGRFMSADPTIPHPDSAQSFNRYSYVRNNPLRQVDPSGFGDFDFGGSNFDCGACGAFESPGFNSNSNSFNSGSWNTGFFAYSGSLGFGLFSGSLDSFSTGAWNDPKDSFGGLSRNSSSATTEFQQLQTVVITGRRSAGAAALVVGEGIAARLLTRQFFGWGLTAIGVGSLQPYIVLGGVAVLMTGDTPKSNTNVDLVGAAAAAGGAPDPDDDGKRSRGQKRQDKVDSILKDKKLPTEGDVTFEPPKKWNPSEPLPRGDQNGFLDKAGREWVKGPSRTAGESFEWDVQLNDGTGRHINVSWNGKITH